jgi:hypothetical protein
VYLEGEALFTVSKNPNRPFFVYNNQIVTQVLGTSFTVQNKNGKIEVAVKTGRVAVYENGEQINLNEVEQKSNGVIITPNQKVTYYQQERHFVTSIVDQPCRHQQKPLSRLLLIISIIMKRLFIKCLKTWRILINWRLCLKMRKSKTVFLQAIYQTKTCSIN